MSILSTVPMVDMRWQRNSLRRKLQKGGEVLLSARPAYSPPAADDVNHLLTISAESGLVFP